MDLRRGMFRVWIICSVIWVILWGLRVFVVLGCRPGGDHLVCFDFWYGITSEPVVPYWVEALGAFAPPLLLLVVGRAVLWAVEGFWGGPDTRHH